MTCLGYVNITISRVYTMCFDKCHYFISLLGQVQHMVNSFGYPLS